MKECKYRIKDVGAKPLFERSLAYFIGPGKTFAVPSKNFDIVKGKWASLLATAVYLGRNAGGKTHNPEAHAQTACIGVAALLLLGLNAIQASVSSPAWSPPPRGGTSRR